MVKIDGCHQIFKSFLSYNIDTNSFNIQTNHNYNHGHNHGHSSIKFMKSQNLTSLKNNIYYKINRKRCVIESLKSNKNSKYLSEDEFKKKFLKAQEYLKNKPTSPKSKNTNQNIVPEPERPSFSERRLSNEEFQARFNQKLSKSSDVINENLPRFRKGISDKEIELKKNETETETETESGNEDEPAEFLKLISSKANSLDKIVMDETSSEKESEIKEVEVEIISVDKSYKPKISTWGIYPRPENISETYGGGRIIDPNEPLESEEIRKKRDEEVQKALRKYRIKMGLEVDPEIEIKFNEIYSKGMTYFNKGYLTEAYDKFDEASKLVNFNTKFAGNAIYQKALCLDSIGKNNEAKVLYKKLSSHRDADVRKEANRMLFSFDAMDNLKTHTMSFSNKNDFNEYFNKIESKYNSTYFMESSGEMLKNNDDDLIFVLIISILVILSPIFLVGFFALQH